jgi:anaerobic ribonucleoside-triphosphate reductase activating protein
VNDEANRRKIRLHAVLKGSLANGPRRAAVVWVQGCTGMCDGCCNPKTHDPEGGYDRDVDDLANDVIQDETVGGMTISGGEPLEQFYQVLHLVTVVHRMRPDLCITLFTRFDVDNRCGAWDWNKRFGIPDHDIPRLRNQLDVLVEGRYLKQFPGKDPLLASTNQHVSFPSGRYGPNDLVDIPRVEVLIHEDGTVVETGIGALLSDSDDRPSPAQS